MSLARRDVVVRYIKGGTHGSKPTLLSRETSKQLPLASGFGTYTDLPLMGDIEKVQENHSVAESSMCDRCRCIRFASRYIFVTFANTHTLYVFGTYTQIVVYASSRCSRYAKGVEYVDFSDTGVPL